MRISYLDLAPFRSTTVGFDRLFDTLNSLNVDADSYPPYDIERQGHDRYLVTLSVAGFRPDEIEVVSQQNLVTVSGRKAEVRTDNYVHKGIANRSFERRFELADFVQVESANLAEGLLTIALRREVPEEMKPRQIAIGGQTARLEQTSEPQPTPDRRADREPAIAQ
jgi:molecular chaperone IbpA